MRPWYNYGSNQDEISKVDRIHVMLRYSQNCKQLYINKTEKLASNFQLLPTMSYFNEAPRLGSLVW